MTRNSLYLLIAALTALAIGLGAYVAWQQSQEPRLEIRVDQGGISVNGNG